MCSLEVVEREVGDIKILDLSGSIDILEGSIFLRHKIRELLEKNSPKIVLNLESVRYIDASGIGEFISSYCAANKYGGALKLLNLKGQVQDMLARTTLLKVFDVFESETEVVASFAA